MTDQKNNDRADLREALQEALNLTAGPGNGTVTRQRPIEEWRRLDRLFRDALATLATPDRTDPTKYGCGFWLGDHFGVWFGCIIPDAEHHGRDHVLVRGPIATPDRADLADYIRSKGRWPESAVTIKEWLEHRDNACACKNPSTIALESKLRD